MHSSKISEFMISLMLSLVLVPGLWGQEGGRQPPKEPMIRLETGFHGGALWSLAVDRAGRLAVTCGEDGTIRLWDLPKGEPAGVLRVPLGPDQEGKLYTCALSPDSSLLAAAGSTGSAYHLTSRIYLIDRVKGTILRQSVVNQSNAPITSLAFSQDGQRLAAGFAGHTGVAVYKVSDGVRIWEEDFAGDACFGLDFDEKGRLVTASIDGNILLFDMDGKSLAKTKLEKKAFRIRFSQDGRVCAVGFQDSPSPMFLDGTTLKPLPVPSTSVKDSSEAVSWDLSQEGFWTCGSVNDTCGSLQFWPRKGGAPRTHVLPPGLGSPADIRVLPGGKLLLACADGLTLLEGSKKLWTRRNPEGIRDHSLRLNTAGTCAGFLLKSSGQPFHVDTRSLGLKPGIPEDLTPPVLEGRGVVLDLGNEKTKPTFNAKPIRVQDDERVITGALAGVYGIALLGTNRAVHLALSDWILWSHPVPATVQGVHISRDGKVIVAALADGTIRWINNDGHEILSFFCIAERGEWIAWTPSGYYDASQGGERFLGIHQNGDRDHLATFSPIATQKAKFHRPDVLALILDRLDEAAALKAANDKAGIP